MLRDLTMAARLPELSLDDGTTVKSRLRELGMSQERAAKFIGINRTAFSRVLNGHNRPKATTLAKLSDLLQDSVRLGDVMYTSVYKATGGPPALKYVLGEERSLEIHLDGKGISFEVRRKPMSSEVELRVRLFGAESA